MFVKLKRKSDRVRDALRRTFSPPDPKPRTIRLEYMSWDGLEALVRSLDNSPGEFGELKSAVERLADCVKTFDAQCRTRLEYSQLRIDMDELFVHLARDLSTPPLLSLYGSHKRIARFAGLVSDLELQQAIFTHDERSLDHKIAPLLEPQVNPDDEGVLDTNNLDEVLTRYRRVRTSFALFLLSENTTIWKIDDNKEAATRLESFPFAPAVDYHCLGPDAVPRNGCMPGTREAVLQDLRDWVHYGKSQNIRWLNGPAGIGKTAVAYSLCEHLESTGKPFAGIFCSREHLACRDVNHILPAISYQLAQQSLPFRCELSSGLEQDLDVARLPLNDQFMKLIATPLGQVGHTFIGDPVIVIDGIEECEDRDLIHQLLRVLVEQASKIPIKLLISILPSRMTHKYMRGTPGERHAFELRLHGLNHSYMARNDISTYLAVMLQYLNLSETNLERLAQRSGASFVYATALVRYLGEATSAERAERLQWFLGVSDPADPHYRDPDVLYSLVTRAILHGGALDDWTRSEVLTLLSTAIHRGAPSTLDVTADILGLDFAHISPAMLSMVLPVFYVCNSDGLSLCLEDAFATYLLSQSHSDRLRQSPEQAHTQLARGCFEVMMSAGSSFNFCELESSCLLDREAPYLEERVNDIVYSKLLYACLSWGAHLEHAATTKDLCSQLENFLSTRLLLWMEILNLTNRLASGLTLLHKLRDRLQRLKVSARTIRLVEDACDFIRVFSASPMVQSTPHIYISALQFWSRNGPFTECYYQKAQRLVALTVEWPARLTQFDTSELNVHLSEALSTTIGVNTYEPSSSDDHREQVVAQPLPGHTDCVYSAAYSPDGAYIASGSRDGTIRIWDAHTGKPVGQPLTGHTGHTRNVNSVAYSPDGAYIASGSADETIRIWDAHTGKPVGRPLIGHTDRVWSVAYSPDGAYIASGSDDRTVRIWDAHSGKYLGQPLTGHTNLVFSVTYSPDGAYIASGSNDDAVRIWYAYGAGKSVGQPLTGHTAWVRSVAYSPDGAYITSGSDDYTIRIWDAHTGKPVGQPLTGHTGRVTSVAYSPDGAYIASGSADKTIRIWDAHTGKPIGRPLTGHTSSVSSVAYSPDGAYIVSGSWDNSVCVWYATARSEPKPVQPPTPSRHPTIEPPRRSFWAIPTSTSRSTHTARPKHSHKVNTMLKQQDAMIDTSITASLHDWTLNEDGWVRGPGGERLLWVPRELRNAVAPPGVKMILSQYETRNFGLDFREARLGLNWQQCYKPS
ncbi:hypothetical protein FRC12_013246 [Ceratobasidium sp. 428]|nr:hypothetical protein FRC12_013246 [Ceratobasidium sp. 428]